MLTQPIKSSYSLLGLLLICLISAVNLWGQDIQGTISSSKGEPVEYANVILQQGNQMLAFAITKSDGRFVIKSPEQKDSLSLKITHLNYDDQIIPITKTTQSFDIILKNRTYDLPEVAVENPPIMRKGDTLVFDLAHYQRKSDSNLEEVLRRLPGVTISPEGKILHKGLEINKFYIEGLDMLEGRYNVVTKNLNLKHIRDIEILENHQPIRVLNSLEKPDNSAINIRLKSNVALTGSYRGVAAAPLNGLLGSNVFGFTKKQQFSVNGSFNTIGERKGQEFISLYSGNALNPAIDLLSVQKPNVPYALRKPTLYVDNEELAGGFNFLRKIGTFTQLKFHGNVIRDVILKEGLRRKQYALGNVTSSFEDNMRAHERPFSLEGQAIIEHNSPNLFTKLNSKFISKWRDESAVYSINDISSQDQLLTNKWKTENFLQFLVKLGAHAQQINVDITYDHNDEEINITNAFLSSPFLDITNYSGVLQQTLTKRFLGHIYTGFISRHGKWKRDLEIGAKIKRNNINSLTSGSTPILEISPLEDRFQNDFQTNRRSIYLLPKWEYDGNLVNFSFDVPVSYEAFQLQDQLENSTENTNLVTYKPNFYMSIGISKKSSINFSGGLGKDLFSGGDLFYHGLIVSGNRSISTRTNQINIYKSKNMGIGYSYYDPIANKIFSLSASYINSETSQSQNTSFDDTGTQSNYQNTPSISHNYQLSSNAQLGLNKYFDFKCNASYTFGQRDQFFNATRTSVKSHSIILDPELSFVSGRHVMTVSSRWNNTILPTLSIKNVVANYKFSYFYELTSLSSIRFDAHNYQFQGTKKQVWNHILNLRFDYKWQAQKTKVFVSLLNLLDQTYFTSYFQGAFLEREAQIRLNPRQVQVGFKRTF